MVADIAAARPIHLSIVDEVRIMAGGEGPWIPDCSIVDPGVMVIGTNFVSTDAVAMAVMGYDPMAGRGAAPFRKGDAAENDCDVVLSFADVRRRKRA